MGEISLLCEVPHTANVTAKTAVRALRISRENFRSVKSADSQVLLSIIRILGRRLYETTVSLAYLSFTASALLDDTFDPEILADIKMRKDEIGRFTGIFESMATYVSERSRPPGDASISPSASASSTGRRSAPWRPPWSWPTMPCMPPRAAAATGWSGTRGGPSRAPRAADAPGPGPG